MNKYSKKKRNTFGYNELEMQKIAMQTIKKPQIMNDFSSKKPNQNEVRKASQCLSLLKLKMRTRLKSSKSIIRKNSTMDRHPVSSNKKYKSEINDRNFYDNSKAQSFISKTRDFNLGENSKIKNNTYNRLKSNKVIDTTSNLPIKKQTRKYNRKFSKKEDFTSTLHENKKNSKIKKKLSNKNTFSKVDKGKSAYQKRGKYEEFGDKAYKNKMEDFSREFEKSYKKDSQRKNIKDYYKIEKRDDFKNKKRNNKGKIGSIKNDNIKDYYKKDDDYNNEKDKNYEQKNTYNKKGKNGMNYGERNSNINIDQKDKYRKRNEIKENNRNKYDDDNRDDYNNKNDYKNNGRNRFDNEDDSNDRSTRNTYNKNGNKRKNMNQKNKYENRNYNKNQRNNYDEKDDRDLSGNDNNGDEIDDYNDLNDYNRNEKKNKPQMSYAEKRNKRKNTKTNHSRNPQKETKNKWREISSEKEPELMGNFDDIPLTQQKNGNDKFLQEVKEAKRVKLVECPKGCGRSFANPALIRHKKICKKIFLEKRKVFSSFTQRKDLEGGIFGKVKLKKVNLKQLKREKKNKKVSKWKLQSAQLRSGLRAGKGIVDKNSKEAKYIEKFQKDSKMECKFCGRSFNEKAGQRHVIFCEKKYKDQQFKNKNKKNNSKKNKTPRKTYGRRKK